MKVRVLYPTAIPDFDGEAADEITIEDAQAEAYIAAGFVEKVEAKKATRKKATE
jgi:hypothetical protein